MLEYWDVDKRERRREGYTEGGKLFSPSLSAPARLVSRLLEERIKENEGGGSRERALPVFHLTCRVRQGGSEKAWEEDKPSRGRSGLSAAASKVTPF